MPEHHSVGWSTLLITPEASSHASLFCTLLHRGIGILRAVNSEKSFASGFNCMLYLQGMVHTVVLGIDLKIL